MLIAKTTPSEVAQVCWLPERNVYLGLHLVFTSLIIELLMHEDKNDLSLYAEIDTQIIEQIRM